MTVPLTSEKKFDLKLDRLSVCFTDENHDHVKKTCGLLIDDHIQSFTPAMTVTKNQRYHVSCQISLPFKGATIARATFEAGPRLPGNSSYRLDLNPAKMSKDAWIDLTVFLKSCIDADTVEFFRGGKITRCDLAIDVPGLHVSDTIIRTSRLQKHGIYSDRHGEPKTIYMGTPRSRRVVAYEKSVAGSGESCLRLECRVKPRIWGYEMHSLTNPFAGVELVPANFSATAGLAMPPEFIADSIRVGGIKRAYKPLDSQQRKALRKAWTGATPIISKLDVLWTTWPDLLISYGLGKHFGVFPSHFMPTAVTMPL